MPTKTIYVSDEDLPIFESAQKIAGDSLSSTIVASLRAYLKQVGLAKDAWKEIEVEVGSIAYTKKRFIGRLVGEGFQSGNEERRSIIFKVFSTQKGNLILYRQILPRLTDLVLGAVNPQMRVSTAKQADEYGDFELQVFESLEALSGHIPKELYLSVTQNISGIAFELLDV